MDRLRYPEIFAALVIYLISFLFTSCGYEKIKYYDTSIYNGNIKTSEHTWLKDRKIFLDPGHGGYGKEDRFRIGKNDITEEAVNLRVALRLEEMLRTSGADVKMTRRRDLKVSLDDRVKMAAEFLPELLVSIHHNGTARKDDNVNYPTVLIWGSSLVRPASYDFARLLQNELNNIMDNKGKVLSDYSVYSETGTRILRETRYICPGALGEGGFFTDQKHSLRLKDKHYNQMEAEAYFKAISFYFKRGIPGAEVLISSKIDNDGNQTNMIHDENPVIAIRVLSTLPEKRIKPGSLVITIDNIKASYRKVTDDLYRVYYGKKLYPGGHSMRFRFRNYFNQSSMIFSAPVTVNIKKGDYRNLINRGRYLLYKRKYVKEGLKMLISAYSMSKTDPDTDRLVYDIARGFYITGDRANSEYFFKKLYYFYPDSRYAGWKKKQTYYNNSFRFPVDYYGKRVEVTGEIDINTYITKSKKPEFEGWLLELKKKLTGKDKEKKLQR